MTADLLAFLAAVHDADEQAARAAALRDAEWCTEEGREETWDSPHHDPAVIAGGKPILVEDVEYSRGGAVEHIARHDPQSVLARVEAERMLTSGHEALGPDLSVECANACAACYREEFACDDRRVQMPCPTLRALAWGYRHREGWRAEWAPDGVEVGA